MRKVQRQEKFKTHSGENTCFAQNNMLRSVEDSFLRRQRRNSQMWEKNSSVVF